MTPHRMLLYGTACLCVGWIAGSLTEAFELPIVVGTGVLCALAFALGRLTDWLWRRWL